MLEYCKVYVCKFSESQKTDMIVTEVVLGTIHHHVAILAKDALL